SYTFKIIKLTKRRRNVVLSRRKLLEEERGRKKDELMAKIEVSQLLPGVVKNITDFGAFVDVGGIDGLLHVTDMSWGRVKHPSHVVSVGDEVEVMVLSFDKDAERISLGLKQKTADPWKTVAEKYPAETRFTGKVVSMTDYGAFIQLEEGVEGMVHVSEMSWTKRIRHPSDVLEISDDIEVQVLSVDAENEKISLGIKQTHLNPWLLLEDKFPVGTIVEGEVRNLTDYGAFIQIDEDIDGLLHISDMSWTRKIHHPSELMKKGDLVNVQVLNIDPQKEKISLGLKQLERDPWDEISEQITKDDLVEVEVVKLVSFGAFARLDNGIEGLIHVSEMSRERVAKPDDVVNIGDRVSVKIINVDPASRKIGLSMKQTAEDAEAEDVIQYMDSAGGDTVSVGEMVGEAMPPGEAAEVTNSLGEKLEAAVAQAEAAASVAASSGETTEELEKAEESEEKAEEPEEKAEEPEEKAEEPEENASEVGESAEEPAAG
ncbi:30S ribosomal protein S1, partial [Candidatus Hydrogenedentota bacterium]